MKSDNGSSNPVNKNSVLSQVLIPSKFAYFPLPTANVVISGPKGDFTSKALLDDGSHKLFYLNLSQII